MFLLFDENENLGAYIIVVEKKYSLFYNYTRDQQYIRDQLHIFRSSNKLYFNYDREKPRERQRDIVPRHRDDYNSYMKRLLNNKPDNKDKKKDYNKHRSERRPEHYLEHRFEHYKYK